MRKRGCGYYISLMRISEIKIDYVLSTVPRFPGSIPYLRIFCLCFASQMTCAFPVYAVDKEQLVREPTDLPRIIWCHGLRGGLDSQQR